MHIVRTIYSQRSAFKITPDKGQSKAPFTIGECWSKVVRNRVFNCICRDRWKLKILFLVILDQCSSIVKSIDCRTSGVKKLFDLHSLFKPVSSKRYKLACEHGRLGSACISAQLVSFWLALGVAKGPTFLQRDYNDSDQTVCMCRLISISEIFLPFWSQGPVEFGEKSIWTKLDAV